MSPGRSTSTQARRGYGAPDPLELERGRFVDHLLDGEGRGRRQGERAKEAFGPLDAERRQEAREEAEERNDEGLRVGHVRSQEPWPYIPD